MIVENLKSRVITCGVDLVPGINTLNEKQKKIFLAEIETAERYQDNNIIEVHDKDTTKLDANILDLNVKETIAFIKKTYHVEKLEELIDEESEGKSRGSVIKAIEKQIALVHSMAKKKEKESEEE